MLFLNRMTNKKLMSVSIIIPIYNSSKYIGACIDSIFSQECEEADIECILVNDCTPDDSMEVVQSKLKDYKGNIHFQTIHFDKNSGHCAARALAAQHAPAHAFGHVLKAPRALGRHHDLGAAG